MTDCSTSTTSTDGYLFVAGKLWRAFQATRQERALRQKQGEALRDLNSAQLRDIGYIRDEMLESHHDLSASNR